MSSSNKIVSATIWTTILNVVNAAYGFISVPILLNYFGKAEYGLIGLAASVNVYLQLMDLGFTNTNVRFFSMWITQKNNEKVKKAFQTSLSFYGVIGLINTLAMIVIAIFAGVWFNVTPEQSIVLRHLFLILALVSFLNWESSCFDQLIRATENVAWIQKRALLIKALMIVVLLGTVFLEFSIELYYLLTCIVGISIIPLSLGKINKELPFVKIRLHWDKEVFKEMLPYSLNLFSFGLFQFAFLQFRPVFLGIRGTIESVTDYQVLVGITGLIQLLGGAFVNILLPSTSKIVAEGNKDAYYRVAYDGTKYISILKAFCCFGLMSVGTELITVYVGRDYLFLFPWLCFWLVCLLGGHNQAISSLIMAGSDVRALSYSSFCAAVVGMTVCWFLIPVYHVGGTVIAFLCYSSVQLLFFYLYYWPKKMEINSLRVFTQSFLPPVMIGVVSLVAARLVPDIENTWLDLFLKGFIFALLYIVMVYFSLNKQDKDFFGSIIKRRRYE